MKLANTLLLLSLCHRLQTTLAQPPSDIEFVAFGFDLSNLNELWVTYDISTGETYAANLYEKDCSTSISDLNIESTTATTSLGDGGVTNATHDRLVLEYDIDTTNLESSNIWNAATSTIELCQVVQLKLGAFIVAEDIRRIDYNLDLNVDIVVDEGSGLIQMADHSSKELTGSGDLTHAIESCKCDAVNFVCNTDPLEPNSELHICIKSTSSDVRIEAIELMVSRIVVCDLKDCSVGFSLTSHLSLQLAYQGSFAMTIMSNNNPASTGLTSVRSNSIATDVPSTNGETTADRVLVKTKLPFIFLLQR